MNWKPFPSLLRLFSSSEASAKGLGLIVLLVGLALTFWAWRLSIHYELSKQRSELHHDAAHVAVAISERLAQYQTVERSGQALFAISPTVNRSQWRTFVEGLRIETNFLGLQGLAFIAYVPQAQLTHFLSRTRADGVANFTVYPEGRRDSYCLIQYNEPEAQNAHTLGFDSCTAPALRAAMEQARDTGRPVLTNRLQPQASAGQSMVILYAPVYHRGAAAQTLEERRSALQGWIGAQILVDGLMEGVIPDGSTIALKIFDGQETSPAALLYSHENELGVSNEGFGLSATYSDRVLFSTPIELGGRVWTLHFTRQSVATFGSGLQVVASGILISGLLFMVLWSLGRTKARAQALAEQMTAALQDSENAIRALYEVTAGDNLNTEEKIQALLSMGCRRFGLNTGILSHVEGERYEIVAAVSPEAEIAKGGVYHLDDTYCRNTLQANAPLGIEQVSGTALQNHPCHRRLGWEAYLGAPVMVGGQPYGTLNFSSHHPRSTSFTTLDQEILQLMVQWIGGVLEREVMEEESRRHQAMLAHASRLSTMGGLASGLAHELNQPLTTIVNFTEACINRLRAGAAEPQESLAILEKIAAQSMRAGEIIRRMRRFVRKGEAQRNVVEVVDIIDEIRDFVAMEARRRGIAVHYQLERGTLPVLADRIQIQQVILNLTRNAMEAIQDHSGPHEIHIQVSYHTDTMIEIAIRDTGPGLSAETAARILHPFFTTKPDGLGLGLTISQSIIEAHGGRLWATPNANPGATFHFTLPLARKEARYVH